MNTLEQEELKQRSKKNLEYIVNLVRDSFIKPTSSGRKLLYMNKFGKLIEKYEKTYGRKFVKYYKEVYNSLKGIKEQN